MARGSCWFHAWITSVDGSRVGLGTFTIITNHSSLRYRACCIREVLRYLSVEADLAKYSMRVESSCLSIHKSIIVRLRSLQFPDHVDDARSPSNYYRVI
ncbi:hypothetical protein GGR52DRAFT_300444 [Hypoxylon sp. FL1284]|nr:hypothetical protein GGR52DRAFT_300444 [Hypoxylon sp. FL1284]